MKNERLEQIRDSIDFQLSAEKNLKIYKEIILEEKELLDYITNLQEENESLKELNVCIGCNNSPDYKSRIDKAIRYIEKCRDYHKTNHSEEKIFPDEITSLLMILNGDDEELLKEVE